MKQIEFNKVYNRDCIDGMRETAAKKKVAHNAKPHKSELHDQNSKTKIK